MLQPNIDRYKRKFYINQLIKGSITAGALFFSLFYFVNIIEYLGNFNTVVRTVLFYSFVCAMLGAFVYWIAMPLWGYLNKDRQLSDLEAAQQIGNFFPDIRDKLVNTLQLSQLKTDTDLLFASLAQREQAVSNIDFATAIDLSGNRKYLKYLAVPLAAILVTAIVSPRLFLESTPRLVQYNRTFEPKAPFDFLLENAELKAFKNEDFTIELKLQGDALPQAVHIVSTDGRKLKMNSETPGEFTYTIKKIQEGMSFQFESAGYQSRTFDLQVFTRPALRNFNVYLSYPAYLKKADERLENTGNLIVPQGTQVKWQFNTFEAEALSVKFANEPSNLPTENKGENLFEFNKKAVRSDTYQLLLENEFSKNKDIIEYYINVIPDEYPSVALQKYEDTLMYDYLVLGGNIADDYGITALNFMYKVVNDSIGKNGKFTPVKLAFNNELNSQSYFHNLNLNELNLKQGDKVEYFVEVWDNDQVNGRKSSRTSIFEFKLPSKQEFKEELAKNTTKTEDKLEESLDKAKEINKEIEDLQDRLKGKRKLDWQDKKQIEKLLEKNQQIQQQVQDLQQMNEQLNKQNQKFSAQNEELQQKAEQLQKLMDELLDEETKRLYEELQKMMEQNFMNQDLQNVMDKLEMKEKNLMKELERALELFKQLKFDTKAEEIAKELEELAKEQEDLAKETEEAKKNELPEIQQEQEEINEKFEEVKKDLEELNEINESLENKKDLEEFDEQQKAIEQEQQQVDQNLQEQKQKKASESQQRMSEQMQQMAEKMQQMQESMEMQQMEENYDDLRKILENLLRLSFDQEELMLEFQKVKRIDPKYNKLSQDQLKLKDDARIIEDSLMSLAKRVFQIESFVTREVGEMNQYMDESLDAIRKRTPELASGKQQFAMTSINNLALLLNDILKQMQQQLSQQMSGKQMSEKKGGSPKLSDLQKQLNQRIEDLKKSGKSGRELSEELAKLAAEQEMIRNAMKQQGKPGQEGKEKGKGEQGQEEGNENGEGGEGGEGGYKELLEKMEKTEEDLVNKRLTQETLMRQKEILTRLLESEKAERERELDEKREAKTAENKEKKAPSNFDEYLKLKEMQIELLKTIPASLNPYYKKKVNEYFKKINNQ